MTILDIAREAGVSTATVSRTLNHPEQVSEKTRAAILRVVEKHNYTLNAAAQEMVTRKTRLVGVLVPDITNDYVSIVLENLARTLSRENYSVFIAVSNMQESTELALIENFKSKRVEAVVLLGNRLLEPAYDNLLVSKVKGSPILRVGNTACEKFYCASPAEREGAFQAVEHLIQQGHSRIAFLNGSCKIDSYYYKQQGFEQAIKQYGIVLPQGYVAEIDTPQSEQGFYRRALELLRSELPPTAFFAASDQYAMGVYKAAYSLGLRIPQDISVVGFSGSPISESLFPELTTVSQYAAETGSTAGEYLLKILKGEPDLPVRLRTRTELVVRGSTSVCRA